MSNRTRLIRNIARRFHRHLGWPWELCLKEAEEALAELDVPPVAIIKHLGRVNEGDAA